MLMRILASRPTSRKNFFFFASGLRHFLMISSITGVTTRRQQDLLCITRFLGSRHGGEAGCTSIACFNLLFCKIVVIQVLLSEYRNHCFIPLIGLGNLVSAANSGLRILRSMDDNLLSRTHRVKKVVRFTISFSSTKFLRLHCRCGGDSASLLDGPTFSEATGPGIVLRHFCQIVSDLYLRAMTRLKFGWETRRVTKLTMKLRLGWETLQSVKHTVTAGMSDKMDDEVQTRMGNVTECKTHRNSRDE